MTSLHELHAALLSRCERQGDCLVFTGGLSHGYSQINRSISGKSRTWRGHQIAYQVAHGPIPDGWQVHHACGNRACIEPDHLEILDPAEHQRLHHTGRRKLVCVNGHDISTPETRYGVSTCRTCKKARNHAARKRTV